MYIHMGVKTGKRVGGWLHYAASMMAQGIFLKRHSNEINPAVNCDAATI